MNLGSAAKQVLDICEEALELEGDERETFVLDSCVDNPWLCEQVFRLLKAVDNSGDFWIQ